MNSKEGNAIVFNGSKLPLEKKEFTLNDIVSGTVHRFQGDQKDIVIFDIPEMLLPHSE